jgi:hypothetical protein
MSEEDEGKEKEKLETVCKLQKEGNVRIGFESPETLE